LESVFSVTRPVTPDSGCLWCNGLISRSKLQEEAQTEGELRAQRYVDEPDVVAPSVITLNAAGAAQAVNDFLFYMTGLTEADATQAYRRYLPLSRETWLDHPRKAEDCPECGRLAQGRLARGDARRLPTFFRAS
jgi:hypothetical protein